MDKVIGFAPDADPTTPGALLACENIIPADVGVVGAPTGITPASTPALAAACIGAAVAVKLDDTRRVFAGTTTKLYELSGGAWADVSAGSYTGGSDTRWSFCQFGDASIAANLADKIQRSTSGAFAAIATAPKAKIVFTVGGFVMALNTVDGTYGTSPDRWWCSALYDETSWTPSVTTQANTGRLVSTQGRLTAGGRLGDYAVAYKEKAIYLGQYTGTGVVWDWQQVTGGDAGCVGQDAWCDIGGAHFTVGKDNFWLFDGSRPTPLGVGMVRNWFFSNSNPATRYRTQCIFDRKTNRVWIFYPSTSATDPDSALVYHVGTKQWGTATIPCEAVLNYISAGMTIHDLATLSATIDGLPNYPFDSPYWVAGGQSLGLFNTSHQLQLLTGAAGTSTAQAWYVGDDDIYTLMDKVRCRFSRKPTAATIETYYSAEQGGTETAGSAASMADGKFDVLDSGRWHRCDFTFTGDHTLTGIGMNLIQEGDV
jgi:hypothetical protein